MKENMREEVTFKRKALFKSVVGHGRPPFWLLPFLLIEAVVLAVFLACGQAKKWVVSGWGNLHRHHHHQHQEAKP
jgi:hypothetical protein